MNFIEIWVSIVTGWLLAHISLIDGFRLMKPYLDRRLLPAKKEKLPEPIELDAKLVSR